MEAQAETYRFEAETTQLLKLMIHSLYTDKEIFLRELISIASDAIDRLRFEALTRPELVAENHTPEIRIEVDSDARRLTLHDNGIGMSREELIANIGTIAQSGTRSLLDQARAEGQSEQALAELIGRFGVGFYSAFMVADRVRLITRRAGQDSATAWESSGDGEYRLSPAQRAQHGTSISLDLKPADPENGLEDFTQQWTLSSIVKRHSDFVSYPITMQQERHEPERDADGTPKEDGSTRVVVEDTTLNSMKPIWTRPQSEVSEEEYGQFYTHVAHDWNPPLKTLTFRAEGRFEFQALVFVPSQAPFDLYYHTAPFGLQLYAQRVMIMERCEDLLPRYLRFLRGVVDSADLPLNISRQRLQQDRHISQIRQWLSKRVLDALTDLADKDSDTFTTVWEQFGRTLKEGVSADPENKDRLLPLLRFPSSHDPQKLTSLKDYVERMRTEQTAIYYLTGESRRSVENSPHLEAFKDKGYEVLYLVDPVDELVVQAVTEFEGKTLQSVGKGTVQLGSESERQEAEKALKEQAQDYAGLLEALHKKLDEHVKEVRLSTRLTSSPVCLVGAEHDHSPQLERLLAQTQTDLPKQKRIMELNPSHPILTKLYERYRHNSQDAALGEYAQLLFGYGLLAEGSELPDPAAFNQRVADLMVRSL